MNSLGKLHNTHARQPLSLHETVGLYVYVWSIKTTKEALENNIEGLDRCIVSLLAVDYGKDAIHRSLLSVQITLKSCSKYSTFLWLCQMPLSLFTSGTSRIFSAKNAARSVQFMLTLLTTC